MKCLAVHARNEWLCTRDRWKDGWIGRTGNCNCLWIEWPRKNVCWFVILVHHCRSWRRAFDTFAEKLSGKVGKGNFVLRLGNEAIAVNKGFIKSLRLKKFLSWFVWGDPWTEYYRKSRFWVWYWKELTSSLDFFDRYELYHGIDHN